MPPAAVIGVADAKPAGQRGQQGSGLRPAEIMRQGRRDDVVTSPSPR